MNLWVRSQNEEILKKVENLDVAKFTFDGDTKYYVGTTKYNLGEYSSKERALEVLDEIQDQLINYGNVGNLIYEMPKE